MQGDKCRFSESVQVCSPILYSGAWTGGVCGATGPPNIWQIIYPIPIGEGRLSPPITTGTPNVVHLPASLFNIARCPISLKISNWFPIHKIFETDTHVEFPTCLILNGTIRICHVFVKKKFNELIAHCLKRFDRVQSQVIQQIEVFSKV